MSHKLRKNFRMSKETSYYAKEEDAIQKKLEDLQKSGAEEHEIRQQVTYFCRFIPNLVFQLINNRKD